MRGYLREPEAIYRRSFEIIEAEAELARFSPAERAVAIRLIHACGMPEIAPHLVFSDDAATAGIAALAAGAPVICDAEMVRRGVIAHLVPAKNPLLCEINGDLTRDRARTLNTTRSAAAIDLLSDRLEGAIVAIGNAPTALFHLLEGLDSGWPKPALILGFPVGFVGAAESKAELIADSRGVPFIALQGRRGGSAMAAAAVNALMKLAGGT